MSRVLLGVCDRTCFADNTRWDTNKLGGNTDWLSPKLVPSVTCGECRSSVVFVGQLHCPIESLPHSNRVLYMFVCLQRSCIESCKSWMVLRCQMDVKKDDDSSNTKQVEIKSTSDDFSLGALDWSMDGQNNEPLHNLNLFVDTLRPALFADNHKVDGSTSLEQSESLEQEMLTKLSLDSQEPQKDFSAFKSLYIEVIDEQEVTNDKLLHEEELLNKYLQQENITSQDLMDYSSGNTSGSESYQKFDIESMSCVQTKFFQILRSCPEQVIRYSYKGQPLLYSPFPSSFKIPACSCGSPRSFEFQVMPAIRNYLLLNRDVPEASLEGLDVGSVYVFTCSSNCWAEGKDTAKQEFIFVQQDDSIVKENMWKSRGRYKM